MLKASEIQEREGYVSFEGSIVKATEFIEPPGVIAFGLQEQYPHVVDLPENVAFRILPNGQAVADEFIEDSALDRVQVLPKPPEFSVGDTVTVNGVESLVFYKADSEQEWGRYIIVDKIHDIAFYTVGLDLVDVNIPSEEHQYSYEWGGYQTDTGVVDQSIGSGLTNTNTLISMNLQPNTEGWPVVWNKVVEARQTLEDDKWFVPSLEELNLLYNNRSSLQNISYITDYDYWSSSEKSNQYAYRVRFNGDTKNYIGKFNRYVRVRLCRYLTDSEVKELTS